MSSTPRAFMALPREARESGLQNAIKETLDNNGVEAVSILIADYKAASSSAANIQD